MKYLRTYESYKNSKLKPVNEEFLGKLFGNLFKKMKDTINKTKGGVEVEAIYQKYIKTIQDEVQKQAKISLEIEAAAKGTLDQSNTPTEPKKEGEDKEGEEGEVKKESFNNRRYQKIFEAEETEKISSDILKQKKALIDQIIKKNQELALKEMDAILKKYGGSSASPQLAAIIDSKKMQFEIDVLNAKADALGKSGDQKSKDEITKEVETKTKDMQTALEQGINKKPLEFKEGDQVVYKREKFNEDEWKKLTDDDKKKPEEGKMKEFQKEMIGIKKISKIDGDTVSFEDADFTKTKGDILMTIEGEKAEGQDDLVKKLGELKSKKPEDITKVGKFVDFISDEANKDKVDEIDKIISGEN